MPAGAPTTYTPEMADKVCEAIAQGASVKSIGKRRDMPCETAIYAWLTRHPEFAEKYARAREQQADVYSQEIVDIADAATPETHMVARLQMDARKWAASKLAAKKYGDKIQADVTAAVTVNIASEHDGI